MLRMTYATEDDIIANQMGGLSVLILLKSEFFSPVLDVEKNLNVRTKWSVRLDYLVKGYFRDTKIQGNE